MRKDLPEIIEQAILDNQENIVPFIEFFEKTPKQIRFDLGKGAWRKMLKNSTKTNQSIRRILTVVRQRSWDCHIPEINQILINLLQKDYRKLDVISSDRAFDFICENIPDKSKITEFFFFEDDFSANSIQIVLDTMRMANDLGETVNYKWSESRFKREHDRFARLGRAKQFGSGIDTEFIYCKGLTQNTRRNIQNSRECYKHNIICEDSIFFTPYVNFYNFDASNIRSEKKAAKHYELTRMWQRYAFEVKLLSTPREYIDESEKMNHCIWSYAKRAETQNYVAFHVNQYFLNRADEGYVKFESIKDEKIDECTLGLNVLGEYCLPQYEDTIPLAREVSPTHSYSRHNRVLKMEFNQAYGAGNSSITHVMEMFLQFFMEEGLNANFRTRDFMRQQDYRPVALNHQAWEVL